MKNKIEYTTLNYAENYAKQKNAYKVLSNCESINTEKEWLCTMAESFHFPVFLKKEKKIINWFEGAYFNSLNCSINWEEFLQIISFFVKKSLL